MFDANLAAFHPGQLSDVSSLVAGAWRKLHGSFHLPVLLEGYSLVILILIGSYGHEWYGTGDSPKVLNAPLTPGLAKLMPQAQKA